MKMKNLFACVAVAGLALSTTAFAEVVTNETYDKTAGTVDVTTSLASYAGDQMTVIVIPAAAYEANAIDDSDIIYIDQAAASADSAIFQDMGLLGGTTLADGDYYIKVGGENIAENGIIVEKFTIKSGVVHAYPLGDANLSGGVDSADAALIMSYDVGMTTFTDEQKDTGDVNRSGKADSADAALIMSYDLKMTDFSWESVEK